MVVDQPSSTGLEGLCCPGAADGVHSVHAQVVQSRVARDLEQSSVKNDWVTRAGSWGYKASASPPVQQEIVLLKAELGVIQ